LLAAEKGDLDIVRDLLAAGAAADVSDDLGWTGLHFAGLGTWPLVSLHAYVCTRLYVCMRVCVLVHVFSYRLTVHCVLC
jgi:hypothetical protein